MGAGIPEAAPCRYCFADVVIEPQGRRVFVGARERAVSRRAFDLLLALCETPGRVLSRDELSARLWPGGQIVSDEALTQAIFRARAVLGAHGERIVTVRGVGIRFDAQVQRESTAAVDTPSPAIATRIDATATHVANDASSMAVAAVPPPPAAVEPGRAGDRGRARWYGAALVALTVIVLALVLRAWPPGGGAWVDESYGIRDADVHAAHDDGTRLLGEALRHDNGGDRARARALLETLDDSDARTPWPALLVGLWAVGAGDATEADRWLARARERARPLRDAYARKRLPQRAGRIGDQRTAARTARHPRLPRAEQRQRRRLDPQHRRDAHDAQHLGPAVQRARQCRPHGEKRAGRRVTPVADQRHGHGHQSRVPGPQDIEHVVLPRLRLRAGTARDRRRRDPHRQQRLVGQQALREPGRTRHPADDGHPGRRNPNTASDNVWIEGSGGDVWLDHVHTGHIDVWTPFQLPHPTNITHGDPGFVAPGNPTPRADSPLVDAGNANPAAGTGSRDAAGRTRVVGSRVDIGAYESRPNQAPTLVLAAQYTVAPAAPAGTLVFTAAASDDGVPAAIAYGLSSQCPGLFTIDSVTGAVRLAAANPQAGGECDVTVAASDGELSANATTHVVLLAVPADAIFAYGFDATP